VSEKRAPGAPETDGFGAWTWIALVVIFCASLYSDVSRFINPDGEKYMPGYFRGGQMDFSYPYLGARAWLAGENPYTTPAPEFTHKVFEPTNIHGKLYKQLYPPGHLLTLIPLALIYGSDSVGAGRLFFEISLVALAGLGLVTWSLLQSARGQMVSPLFIFPAVTAFLLFPGAQLGLERGHADILTALLCWGALALLMRRVVAPALFLVVWAVNIKGYPLLFAAGLALLMLRSRAWRPALLGALLGAVVFVAPAARFLGDAFRGTIYRSSMFEPVWFNHGFKNVVHNVLSPGVSDRGRLVLSALALAVTALWGWRAWQRRHELAGPDGALALIMFGTASLLAMVGLSSLSISYNLSLVVPGVLLLATCQDRVVARMRIGRAGGHLLGAVTTACGFMLFLCRWGPTFPLAGLGLVVLLATLGLLGVRMPAPRASAAAPEPAGPEAV